VSVGARPMSKGVRSSDLAGEIRVSMIALLLCRLAGRMDVQHRDV
jgi:hypothetical protein